MHIYFNELALIVSLTCYYPLPVSRYLRSTSPLLIYDLAYGGNA